LSHHVLQYKIPGVEKIKVWHGDILSQKAKLVIRECNESLDKTFKGAQRFYLLTLAVESDALIRILILFYFLVENNKDKNNARAKFYFGVENEIEQ
jgi:hypothetical protein